MSLPKEYNKALHQNANFYASWFPVTAPFAVGDYGIFQNGVFQKIGHLDDLRGDGFNVEIRKVKGEPTAINFLSEGIKTVKLVAGAEVTELPSVPNIVAKLAYEFNKKNSFVVKAAEMNIERMENVQQVADKLAELRRNNKWSHSYHVVSTTYTGVNCLVLLSSEASSRVEFSGQASALKQLDLGNVEVKPSVSFSSSKILQSIGKTGVLGLGLFKLSFFLSSLQFAGPGELSEDERKIEEDMGDEVKDWEEEPDDVEK